MTRLRKDEMRTAELRAHKLELENVHSRMRRLTEGYIDGVLDKEAIQDARNRLIQEEVALREKIARLEAPDGDSLRTLEEFLELSKSLEIAYQTANPDEKRLFLRNFTSNLQVAGKKLNITPTNPAHILLRRSKVSNGAPYRGTPRTLTTVLQNLLGWFTQHATALEESVA
jgi:hypothetical protein